MKLVFFEWICGDVGMEMWGCVEGVEIAMGLVQTELIHRINADTQNRYTEQIRCRITVPLGR